MEAIALGLVKVKFLVDQAIKQRGEDYVYEKDERTGSCLYVHPHEEYDEETYSYEGDYELGTPGCLVGLALIKAGVPMEEFRARNDEGSSSLLGYLTDNGTVTGVTDEVKQYLYNVQSSQDNGHTWGASRDAAERGATLEKNGNERTPDPVEWRH